MKKIIALFCLIATSVVLHGQVKMTISGTVKDAEGKAIPGTHVQVKGTNVGTETNIDGCFTIQVQREEY